MADTQKQFAMAMRTRAYNQEDQLLNFSKNNELLNVATLLEKLNINAENAGKMTRDQLAVLAEIAEDGKITNEELERTNQDYRFMVMRN